MFSTNVVEFCYYREQILQLEWTFCAWVIPTLGGTLELPIKNA